MNLQIKQKTTALATSLRTAAGTAGRRLRLAVEAAVILLLLLAWIGVESGHLHGDVQIDGFTVGGGTAQEAQAEQTATRYASTLPYSAVTPPPQVVTPAQASQPGRKPRVPQ